MIEPDRPEGDGPTQHQAHDRDTVHLAEIHERPGQTVLDEFDAWPEVVRREASDLHIKVGTPPKIRDAGALIRSTTRRSATTRRPRSSRRSSRPNGVSGSKPRARSTSRTRSRASVGSG